mgnify:CR=1 FL=1
MRTTISSEKQLKMVSHLLVFLYMDDMLLSGRHAEELVDLVHQLELKFAMKDRSCSADS